MLNIILGLENLIKCSNFNFFMKDVFNVINELENSRQERNISRDSIEFISLLCRSIKPINILEIGCFNGYSALWLSLYSNNVFTIEKYPVYAALALKNFSKANVKNIELIHGDALDVMENMDKKFDIILIDAQKNEYKLYLKLSLKLLNNNGIIFIDNTISHKDSMTEFFEYVERSTLFHLELNIGKGLMMITKIH